MSYAAKVVVFMAGIRRKGRLGWNMIDSKQKLEELLMKKIEELVEEPATAEELQTLPLLAHELVELWRYTSELSSSRNIRRKR